MPSQPSPSLTPHQMQLVLDTALAGMVVLQCVRDDVGEVVDFELLLINKRAEYIIAKQQEELLGKRVFVEWPAARDSGLPEVYKKAIQSGEPTHFEFSYRPVTGDCWFEMVVVPMDDRVSVTFYDITARKQAEQELQRQKALLETFLNAIPYEVWGRDTGGRVILQNQADVAVWGDQRGQYTDYSKIDPAIVARWKESNRRALAGETVSQESWLCWKGRQRYIHEIVAPIYVNDRITGIVGTNIDITELKQAEARLKSSEEKFAKAFELSPDVILLFRERDFIIIDINQKAEQLFGFTKKELIGRSVKEFSPWTRERDRIAYWQQYEQLGYIEMETVFKRKDGSVFDAVLHVKRIVIEGQPCLLNITRDITERKRHEERIRHDAVELAEANRKMSELKVMALRAAMNPHFIFNSLSSIQYFVAKNDRTNALTYLSCFSKLLRGILNSTLVHKIPLAEELSLLRYYVSLEMLRFDNKFEVVYDLDPAINPSSIQVPSMLIQPYVENAILHGLYNKQENGRLRISLRGQGDALLFQVEDNGVGRAEAARIARQSMQPHKSIGMMLTEERLAIINQRYNVTVSIEDLSGSSGPAGTRVNIFLKT